MAVRKVVTRRSRNVRGYMPSFKMGCAVAWESQNELKLLRILELSGAVRCYDVQPSVETIQVGNELQIYFPDVQVTYKNGRTVTLEVKPKARMATPKVAARMKAFAEQCELVGREFFVITDEELESEVRNNNAEELMYHRRPISREIKLQIFQRIQESGPTNVGELQAALGLQLTDIALGLGLVGVNLEELIKRQSAIYINGGHLHANLHP